MEVLASVHPLYLYCESNTQDLILCGSVGLLASSTHHHHHLLLVFSVSPLLRVTRLAHLLAGGLLSRRDLFAPSAAAAADKETSCLWRERPTVTPLKS